MDTDLRDRIASAIARKTASKAPDEVLEEIQKTHVLIPRELVERAAKAKRQVSGTYSFDAAVVVTDLARYWKGDADGR